MKVTARFAIFVAVITSAAAPLYPALGSEFSASIVFQPSFRGAIDSRCIDARKDAEAIGADPMTVPLITLADAYQELQACATLSRLPQFKDQTTYMQLAAATSAYLIGIRSSGQQAAQGLAYAEQIDKRILSAHPHTEMNMGYQNDVVFGEPPRSNGGQSGSIVPLTTAPGTPGTQNHDTMRMSGVTVNPGIGSKIDLNMLDKMTSDLYAAIQTRIKADSEARPQVQASTAPYRTP
jgi:hypothetical protein